MNQNFQNYISSHFDLIELALFISLFIISWNIENIYGVFFKYKKWKHAFVNAPFIFTNLPGQLILGVAFVGVIKWTSVNHFGLLYYFHFDKKPLLLFLITFLLLDFGEYIYHLIMHKVDALWKFHLVHHSDNKVDVSTTLREHPGENIIRLSFTLMWVFLSGAIFWAILLRQIIQVFTTMFAHINYRLPEKLDKIIGLVFITPNLHQVHHHYQNPYTDSNYGDVLSIWDRMFGTLKKLPAEDLVFGVDTHMKEKDTESFRDILKIPFAKNS
jgi:sterol desaturase/sphingolipid hydroxylase (fatty acid hydroxylase superfamily)